ncbi:MAG: maleylpyruvate isomerase N-terminal domain-containing protein [Thermoflexales bacterium]
MTVDRTFIETNRASSARIRALAARLSDDELGRPVGEHWTVAIAFAHLAFWDRRVLHLLDIAERDGVPGIPSIDVSVNDLSLPLWAALPPREAARIAVEASAALDKRLETYPPQTLELVYAGNPRWVQRGQHRNAHLDEIDAALNV